MHLLGTYMTRKEFLPNNFETKEISSAKTIDTPLSVKKQRLTILFWNGFWNWPYFGMGEGNAGFVSNNCKCQNCYTINDRDKLTNNLSTIDAVVTHGYDEALSQLATKTVRDKCNLIQQLQV